MPEGPTQPAGRRRKPDGRTDEATDAPLEAPSFQTNDPPRSGSSGAQQVQRDGSEEAATLLQPRRVPRQLRAQATVQAVLRAAGEEIERAGLDRLSTKRIAAAAGISVGSLYGYFPNKESIIAALLEAWLDRVYEAIDSMHPRHGANRDIFSYLTQQMDRARLVYEDQPGLGALFGMIMAMPALHDTARRHGQRVSDSLATALARYAPHADAADIRSVAHTIPVLCHELLAVATLDPQVDRQRMLIDMRVCLMALGTRLLVPAR